jgi:hypothetical protein
MAKLLLSSSHPESSPSQTSGSMTIGEGTSDGSRPKVFPVFCANV